MNYIQIRKTIQSELLKPAEDTLGKDAARAFGYFNVREAILSPRRWERGSINAWPEGPEVFLASTKFLCQGGS